MARKHDLQTFPRTEDVVRIGDVRWSQWHDELLSELTDAARAIVNGSKSFTEMQARLHRDNPRVHVDGCFAYLLFGADPLQMDDAGNASMHVNGLVFEPQSHNIKRRQHSRRVLSDRNP